MLVANEIQIMTSFLFYIILLDFIKLRNSHRTPTVCRAVLYAQHRGTKTKTKESKLGSRISPHQSLVHFPIATEQICFPKVIALVPLILKVLPKPSIHPSAGGMILCLLNLCGWKWRCVGGEIIGWEEPGRGRAGNEKRECVMHEKVLWKIRTEVRWVCICAVQCSRLRSHAAAYI